MEKNILSALTVGGLLLAGTVLGGNPALAQERQHRSLDIVAPTDGSAVSNPINVTFGFSQRNGEQPDHPAREHHGRGPHILLVVDAPTPEPGSTIQLDATHLPFPEGQQQMTVTLAPGQHSLQLVVVDRDGNVSRHAHEQPPVTITVQ